MGNELAEQGQGNITQFGVGGVAYMQQHYQMLVDATRAVLRKDVDYGVIPGTGTKPVLYKPGAEKLCLLFCLQPVFEVTDRVLNWDAQEPFFFYEYKCKLYHRGVIVGEGDGSCNSHESKYRWRKGERTCPNCGQPAIIKGRAEYGGGWLCYAKKGGCGAKFAAGDPAIEGQEVGRVPNPDVADVVNTVQKMAQKRALVAAVLVTTGASEFYTQDLEDYVDGSYTEVEDKPQAAKSSPQKPVGQRAAPAQQEPQAPARPWEPKEVQQRTIDSVTAQEQDGRPILDADKKRFAVVANLENCFVGDANSDQKRHAVIHYLTGKFSSKELSEYEVMALHRWLHATKDDNGDWHPDPLAVKEANMIAEAAMKDAGQTSMLDIMHDDDAAGRAAVDELQAEADAEGATLTPPMF